MERGGLFGNRLKEKDRKAKKSQSPAHQRSMRQEAELALRGGGQLTPGSGNKRVKGDIAKFHGVFRVEAKTTTKKSFSVTREMIQKLEDSATPAGEVPALVIEFITESQTPLGEVAVIPTYLLEHIARGMKEDE